MSAANVLLAYEVSTRAAITAYAVYIAVSLGLVIYLARTLFKNGAVFLRDVFDSEELAGAINHLLVVGFLLLNLGYAILLYKYDPAGFLSEVDFVNTLVERLGVLILSLGVVHLFNMLIFWRIRKHGTREKFPPAPAWPAPANNVGGAAAL